MFRTLFQRRRPRSRKLQIDQFEDRSNPSTGLTVTNLVSDQPGVAPITDPTLINAWGISLNPNGGTFWVSSNGQHLSELYGGDVNGGALTQPFKVTVPSGAPDGSAPTGQVFNNSGSTTDFLVTDGTHTLPSVFIFASETGEVTGWNPGVGGGPPSLTAENGFTSTDGAIYKGLAIGKVGDANFLFAADFHNNKIDVIDGGFHKVTLGAGGFETFTDPDLATGFAPFNIATINGKLYVSYAKQDAAAEDDVAGKGNGFIDVFEMNGHFDGRLVSSGDLNSPWGMALAPSTFGKFGNDLLVGNFGDGMIHAFDPNTGREVGTLSTSNSKPIVIDGLWGLAFGNGKTAGDANSLYFAAGPQNETHGLFGKITSNPVTANLNGANLTITGSPDGDRVFVMENSAETQITVMAGGQRIGQFDATAVGTIRFNGLGGSDSFVVSPHVTAAVIADGGQGDDFISGGSGNNILIGGAGDDLLFGGSSRDILIGGDGLDKLFGGGQDDILIGGSTAFDSNTASLSQILNVWNSADSYSNRVAAITAGTGGVPKLDASTVTDDGVKDLLSGGGGLDWFFSTSTDRILGGNPAEQVS